LNYFFFFNRAIYQIMWKNIAEPDWLQMTMAHSHFTLDT